MNQFLKFYLFASVVFYTAKNFFDTWILQHLVDGKREMQIIDANRTRKIRPASASKVLK